MLEGAIGGDEGFELFQEATQRRTSVHSETPWRKSMTERQLENRTKREKKGYFRTQATGRSHPGLAMSRSGRLTRRQLESTTVSGKARGVLLLKRLASSSTFDFENKRARRTKAALVECEARRKGQEKQGETKTKQRGGASWKQ